MENELIRTRLQALRALMAKEKIDYYMIPTADFHHSEYVSDHFKVREYFCNFSGSNGTLLVWRDGAGLWTDGRYFIQAEKELEGTGVTLYRMQEEGVPTIEDFLKTHMPEGGCLGFDGRTVPTKQGKKYESIFQEKQVRFAYEKDLAETLWTDRPAFPAGRMYVIPEDVAGRTVSEKLADVRAKVREKPEQTGGAKADAFLLTKLDDIMWLLNLRGCDVECNPVAMSYFYLDADRAVLFIQKEAIEGDGVVPGSERLKLKLNYGCGDHLQKCGIEIREYGEIVDFLKRLPAGLKVMIDDRYCSYTLYKVLQMRHEGDNVIPAHNPTEALKAVKNPVELANMERIFLKDSVALTRFIYWLKTHIGKTEITEVSAADKLEQFRREIPEFIDLSFPTIAGYRANAAMMHYEATPEKHAVLKPEGMLLVDSGGQYMGGTTDVTRTIVLGPVSDEEKYHYTLVLQGMLQLTNARWLHGCSGRNLDILARKPLWEIGLDYKCGTGHGVGYILNVHEGPQSMRWRFAADGVEAVLEDGMDITNEPGVYIEGSHGIRIENVMVAKKDTKNEYGQFMHFDTLTWVPVDMAAVDLQILPRESVEQLIAYQKTVFEKISPYLNEEERGWLLRETTVG
ncbi:MAG: aminopeptidase P family protein [Lachnospiraceae bacterium]|nr:aminopeptidase P family protein [Lachnospiraceae bacterium]